MQKRYARIGFALILLGAAPASAQVPKESREEWWRASIDTQLSFRFVDIRSLHLVAGKPRFWTAFVRGALGPIQLEKDMNRAISLIEVDCAERKTRILSLEAFDRSGKSLAQSSDPQEWDFVRMTHPSYEFIRFGCSNGTYRGKEWEFVPDGEWAAAYTKFIEKSFGAISASELAKQADALEREPSR